MDLPFTRITMSIDTYGIIHNSILLAKLPIFCDVLGKKMYQRWLWSPPQVNEFVYSDVYNFKLDLVPLVRIKLGPPER